MRSASAHHDTFNHSPSRARSPALLLKGVRVLFWGLIIFALTFVELVAELAGPLLLIAGALWWLGLHVLAGIQLEPELQQYLSYVPGTLRAGGYSFTPAGMIRQGLLLLAVVAACRTINGIIARES
ncbi:hypothetical protein [Teichococcus oryzae]|uniref:Uncharacterized protein n=1 Tax=Teichococcus oryzae TaxID=1608942 RepID=A0A5B2TC70_9PROT|nr:hypothetical protein [Pseudoroseomonas oryzae]KAA2212106.1 hypothetical protein F0Q34_16675 [Pseudoroseomonas oryzae]